MNPECQRHQESIVSSSQPDARTRAHLDTCKECSSFYAVERSLGPGLRQGFGAAAPSEELVQKTLTRLRPMLRARAVERRGLFVRVALAGVFTLPVILALNGAAVWLVFWGLSQYVSPQLAFVAAGFMVTTLLLTLSVIYGSLPLLASWGLHLRERTA